VSLDGAGAAAHLPICRSADPPRFAHHESFFAIFTA
jgi:hypothetical protein